MNVIKRKLSIKDILRLLSGPRRTESITVSEGAYNHLPKRALAALKKMKVAIEVVKLKRGKKPVVDVGRIEGLYRAKQSAYEITKKTGIPLRTVYYHLAGLRRNKR